jgi:Zn-dependent protease
MELSFRLGRIAGVEVGVNWSWLVVFALITWSLAVGVFPNQDPGPSDGTYVAMALVAATLFFVSLLGHEHGHAMTARHEGPAVSLLIGGACTVLAWALALPSTVDGVLAWLGCAAGAEQRTLAATRCRCRAKGELTWPHAYGQSASTT